MIRNHLFLGLFLLSFFTFSNVHAKMILPYQSSYVAIPRLEIPTAKNSLLYYGGPVIESVEGFTVFWNASVDKTTQQKITSFYKDYVESLHMDWLAEYKTNIPSVSGKPGTQQTIKRGKWLGETVLNPQNTKKKLQDTEIQAELEHQIDMGTLPQPSPNALYMIHFPSDMSITIEVMTSCNAFGGYHYNYESKKYGSVFYAVIPDCGGFGDSFSEITYVSSHEMLEAITDPFPTAGSNPAYPQAWNSSGGEEIADLCQQGHYEFAAPTGTYVISLEWSNVHNKCFNGMP